MQNISSILSAILIIFVFGCSAYSQDSVIVWYGNLDQSPIEAAIDSRIPIDVYIETSDNAYVADILLVLGTDNQSIDSLLSINEGEILYPFNEWPVAEFLEPAGSPPNPEGWSSQSFLGFGAVYPHWGPWLHFTTPTLAIRFMIKSMDDTLLIGQTLAAIGTGLDPIQGPSNSGDTTGTMLYPVIEYFSPIYFSGIAGIEETELPESFQLFQNYPNPFNAQTTIEYALPEQADVKLSIYDIRGRLVETLVNCAQSAGYHRVTLDVKSTPSGIYFYKLTTGNFTQTRKMILMK